MAARPTLVRDRSGCVIPMQFIEGYAFPPSATPSKISKRLPNGLNDVNAETLYDDDILICSYPRSGYNWLLQMTSMLVSKTTDFSMMTSLARNLELRPGELILRNEKRPRIFHTHFPAFLLPESLMKLRKIFIYRNPKDVAFSLYGLVKSVEDIGYNGCFEDFLQLFLEGKALFGDWFKYMESWQKFQLNNSMCVLSYEQLSLDPSQTLMNVANFLDLDTGSSFVESVVKKCTITNMKEMMVPKLQDRNGIRYFRKGIVGDWRNQFTDKMNKQFDEVYSKKMRDIKFKIQFTL